ncbi:MAG: L,D-transpeptidase family protein [Hyphomicrobiales bacterium]|nr:L,D-transpeptidase family protein [Hyphomicrobiales bacterium]
MKISTFALTLALCAAGASAFAQSATPATPAAPAAPAVTPPAPATPAPATPAPAAPAPSASTPPQPSAPTAAQTAAPAQAAHPRATRVRRAARRAPVRAPIREWALSDDPTPSFQPETFYATVKASERYAAIADAGGWPSLPGAVGPGAHGKNVATLRKRLSIEGDLPKSEATGEKWDSALTEAVKRFQARNGLRQTGSVSGSTLRAINVPAKVRFRQLASSSQRLAGTNFGFGERYVVVNIPSAAVEAVEHGQIVRRYVAVVGDAEHRSPEVSAKIIAVNLNPTWTVPESIIKNEIIPKMRTDPGYLSRAHIRILNGKGKEVNPRSIDWNSDHAINYILRQDSGAGNALGNIRIQMPNDDAVYMHDTPSKSYFARDYRFLSHGCVRVQGVYDLASWLLQDSGGQWSRAALESTVAKGERQDVKLSRPVNVIWVYMTGWASADGTVHFADDVYQVDTIGM